MTTCAKVDRDRGKLIERVASRYDRSREVVEREVCEHCNSIADDEDV